MEFTLTQSETQSMTADQKVAVMESMLMAVLADGRAEKAEVAEFDAQVERIQWNLELAQLKAQMEAARTRVLATASKGEGEVLRMIGGIAMLLPSNELRQKVLHAMCSIMAASDLNLAEKTIVHAFATAFGIPLERLEAIKASIKQALST